MDFELYELLDESQKKSIAEALTKKCIDAINSVDTNEFEEDIRRNIKDVISWCFNDADLDTGSIGRMISNMILTATKKYYDVE